MPLSRSSTSEAAFGALSTAATPTRRDQAIEPRLSEAGVWLVIPCYKVKAHVLQVLAQAPSWVEGIVCVDDACPEGSGDFIEAGAADPRVLVLRLPGNQGVGGATLAGYAEAERRGARILVKVDGDNQMDLGFSAYLVAPILLGEADYVKGNRFTSTSHLRDMPFIRMFGNALLSFLAKLSTGYWNVFDPTNGFTAIEAQVAKQVMQKNIAKRYFFETDLLYHLGSIRAVVRDVPMPARYADEVSNLKVGAVVAPFTLRHLRNFTYRVLGQYFVRDFQVASLELVAGLASIFVGVGYGLYHIVSKANQEPAAAGVVMAAALPIILGVQLLLQAVNFDVLNVPTRPIHPYLNVIARLNAEAGQP